MTTGVSHLCVCGFLWTFEVKFSSYQKHAESFSHDAVEEVEGRVSNHHEEVRQEKELSAPVVQQSVVLAAEQRFIRILWGQKSMTGLWRVESRGLPYLWQRRPGAHASAARWGSNMLTLPCCLLFEPYEAPGWGLLVRQDLIWPPSGLRWRWCSCSSEMVWRRSLQKGHKQRLGDYLHEVMIQRSDPPTNITVLRCWGLTALCWWRSLIYSSCMTDSNNMIN